MKLPKEFLLLTLLVILLVGIAAFLGFRLSRERQFRKLEQEFRVAVTPTPVFDDKFDETKFTTKEYVYAAGRGKTAEFVQVRGVITAWEKDTLKVKVTDETLTIKVSQEVSVRCVPETIKDASGKDIKTTEIYLDFTQATVKGNLVQSSLVAEEISEGDEVTVQSKLIGKEDLTAELIVGYGCNIGLVGL